ncbi:ABC transporter ATP-binding protein/permease [Planktomarina temperata]|nr:ABC transporter ATP-binding protein/permease [Planktomarina temperata]
MNSVSRISGLLDKKQKRNFCSLFIFVFVSAFFEMIGVASIMPFIAVASNVDVIQENYLLSTIYDYFNFTSTIGFLIFMGSAVLFLLTFSMALKSMSVYLQLKTALLTEFDLSKRLMARYLDKPYEWFVTQNTTDLGKNILAEVSVIISQGLMPLIFLVAQGCLAFLILMLLLIVDYQVALITGVVLFSTYLLVFQIMKKSLKKLSERRFSANESRYKKINEAFGAIKLMKLGNTEATFINSFESPAKTYAVSNTNAQAISQIPRFIIEAIAFGGLIAVIIFNLTVFGSISGALPIIALYALSGYKLIPALQQIYWGAAQLKFVEKSVEKLYLDLINKEPSNDIELEHKVTLFNNYVELKSACFRYAGSEKLALDGIDLKINRGDRVALVGKSGSGKTTAVDVLLGLLNPSMGNLTVDGLEINEANKKIWQSLIGYVPQEIFLKDSTIAENIAFNVESPKEIDEIALHYAAKIANLHDFITQELDDGYDTNVGERGMRLSGGQRQRIGLARALYQKPRFLVLDEGTSALDNQTEYEVIQAIGNLPDDITVLMVTHRATSIKDYDKMYMFEGGKITGEGTFEFLVEQNNHFVELNRLEKNH